MNAPKPQGHKKAAIVAVIFIAIAVVFLAVVVLVPELHLVEYGKPSLVIEKAWFVPSNRTVYIDVKNMGGATAHKVRFDVGPGEMLEFYTPGDLGPGRILHLSVIGAQKSDVDHLYLDYDEGSDIFSFSWVRPDVGIEETLTNIYPGVVTQTMSQMSTLPTTKGVLLACHAAYPVYDYASPPFTATTSTVKVIFNVTAPESLPGIPVEDASVTWYLYPYGRETQPLGTRFVQGQRGIFEDYVHGLVVGEKYYIRAYVGDADCDFIVEES